MAKKYTGEFKWVVFGMIVATWLFVLAAAWLITRIFDGNWSDWRLPATLSIVFIVMVIIGGMFTSLSDIKKELDKEKNPAGGTELS